MINEKMSCVVKFSLGVWPENTQTIESSGMLVLL
jgi:hypothetical protein